MHKAAGPLALFAHRAMSDFSPLIAPKRTWIIRRVAASDSCGLQWALNSRSASPHTLHGSLARIYHAATAEDEG